MGTLTRDRAEQRRIVAQLDAPAAKEDELNRPQTKTEAEAAFIPASLPKSSGASCE